MVVSTIAVCPNPSGVCSTHHQSSFEFDLFSGRSSSPPSSTAAPQSLHKSSIGGLSCLFSSQSAKHSASQPLERDELIALKHDKTDDLKCGGKYLGGSYLKSPVSVLQAPISSSPSSSVSGSSPLRIGLCNAIGSHPMFKGFATHALGQCVEYDAPQIGGDFAEDDELTFNMDELIIHKGSVKEMLADSQFRHSIFFDEFVIKAFYEAEKAHRGQMRASGDPYLNHCVETAALLAEIGANSTVVAAGLLHDTIDDSFLSYESMLRTFGKGVADLVKGVSKLSYLSKLARDNDIAGRNVEADRLHTMFLAMADPSAVLVKLADRLHNMMTLDALPLVKRQRFAKETLEIFVPLANRLGISTWKEQLENLCFEHLYPDQHRSLNAQLHDTFDEELISYASQRLKDSLASENVLFDEVYGRHKSLFSIHTKMLKKKVEMREIHDIHGLRLIVQTEDDCYKAMELVHKMWRPVPGQYKDYVAHPKVNGYRSLHTVVQGADTVPFEVQIRTREMHLQAEIGIAAHWRYKEGNCEHSSFVVQMVEWARWVVTWQCQAMRDSLPCSFPSRTEDSPVFVIVIENEKMSVQELPGKSTVGDVVGQGCPVSVRVSCVDVTDRSRELKMGDVVEVGPSRRNKSLTEFREEFQRMYNRAPFSNF